MLKRKVNDKRKTPLEGKVNDRDHESEPKKGEEGDWQENVLRKGELKAKGPATCGTTGIIDKIVMQRIPMGTHAQVARASSDAAKPQRTQEGDGEANMQKEKAARHPSSEDKATLN